MKKAYTVGILLFLPILVFSQNTYDTLWRHSLQAGLNFNQNSFNDNWIGGGVNSISVGSLFNYVLQFEDESSAWRNELDLRYGVAKNENESYKKTSDRLFFDSKYGYKLSDKWRMYSSLNFQTQFAAGYEYNEDGVRSAKISDFMAPAYLTSSWGVEYQPVEYFWLRIGPFSPRITFVLDEELQGNFGVDPGESVRYEWAAFQLVSELNRNLRENLNVKARYEFFANYAELGFDKFDHRLEFAFTSAVTRLVNVNLGTIFLYDIDQVDGLQVSQTLSVGLLYAISTLKDK